MLLRAARLARKRFGPNQASVLLYTSGTAIKPRFNALKRQAHHAAGKIALAGIEPQSYTPEH